MKIQSMCWVQIAAAVTLSGSVSTLCARDFTIRMKMGDGAEGATIYVSPAAIRRTTPGATDVIDRIDRGTIIYLDHRSKTYKEASAAEAREAISKGMAKLDSEKLAGLDPQKKALLHQMGLDAPPELTKIGPGETICGYPTDKYSIKMGMAQGELWITQALQFPAAYYRDFNLLSGVAGPIGDASKIADVHGIVLKRVMTMTLGRSTTPVTETAVSVEMAPVPASVFEPPAAYRKVSGAGSNNPENSQ